jgi:ribosomal protein S18 acetylase RimI-like enzyme
MGGVCLSSRESFLPYGWGHPTRLVAITNHKKELNMNITIRSALEEDSASISRLIIELAENSGETSPITAEYAAQYLGTPGSSILLAEKDRHMIGLISYSIRPNLFHAGDCCLIEEFVVRQSERGQGIGGQLLEALFERLANSNCAEVSVTAMPENLKAIAFYKSHGMVDEAVFLEKHFHKE